MTERINEESPHSTSKRDGCYFWLTDVDPWDKGRDAEAIPGTVAGTWHIRLAPGGAATGAETPRNSRASSKGDDDGCFECIVCKP